MNDSEMTINQIKGKMKLNYFWGYLFVAGILVVTSFLAIIVLTDVVKPVIFFKVAIFYPLAIWVAYGNFKTAISLKRQLKENNT